MFPNPRDRRMPNRPSDGTRTNEDIHISPIRLVKEDGEAIIIETSKALQMAKDAGLDLWKSPRTRSRLFAASSTTASTSSNN